MKALATRLTECIEIRKQLDKLGVRSQDGVADHFNAFIKNGIPKTFRIKLDDKHTLVVQLSRSAQSGVTLEKE